MKNEHKHPPKTVPEIGIHIGYIHEALDDIKESLNGSPTRQEVNNIEVRVTKIEEMIDKIKTRIVVVAITGLVLMILAQYGLTQFFRG